MTTEDEDDTVERKVCNHQLDAGLDGACAYCFGCLVRDFENTQAALARLHAATMKYAAKHAVNVCDCPDCNETRAALKQAEKHI